MILRDGRPASTNRFLNCLALYALGIGSLVLSGCEEGSSRPSPITSNKKHAKHQVYKPEGKSTRKDYPASNSPRIWSPKAPSSAIPTSGTAAGDWGAIAFFGELAPRNFRGSGTYGIYFTPTQRFKVSGEYLTQELNFNFISGHSKKWASQAAVGVEYQYLLDNNRFQSIELGTAYSHAFARHLSKGKNAGGSFNREIMGANGSLSFLGTTAQLWSCSFLSAAIDYDWVSFDRKHRHNKLSNGFGGSLDFVQQFANDFFLNLGAEFRQPFNSYQGLLNWNHRFSTVGLDLGIFGNLTEGHDGVRDLRTVGVRIGITFGPKPKSCGRSPELSVAGKECYARQYCDVSQWVETPAVRVPVVLATSQPATCSGLAPTINHLPGIYDVPIGGTITDNVAQYFNSTLPLSYSLVINSVIVPPSYITLAPNGTLSLYSNTALAQGGSITVTATNSCGSVSWTVDYILRG